VYTAESREIKKENEKVFKLFQSPKQTYKFQRKRRYNAPANHPWRQYKAPVNNAAFK